VDHGEEWEAIFFPLDAEVDARSGKPVDYDTRDFQTSPPEGVVYAIPAAPIQKPAFFAGFQRALRDVLYQDRSLEVYRNMALRVYGRVGESREEFARRCDETAQAGADRETAALRSRYEDRLARARDKVAKAENRLHEVKTDLDSRKRTEMFAGAGDLLGALLGGRGRTRSLIRSVSRGASRRSMTERTGQRLVTAQDQVEAYEEDIAEIEADLAQEIAEIDGRWQEKAGAIETIGIGLERSDVTVSELALVWIPVSSGHRSSG
jgi:multidrug efflux pump subunit AcrA (membrane-fusion protein)